MPPRGKRTTPRVTPRTGERFLRLAFEIGLLQKRLLAVGLTEEARSCDAIKSYLEKVGNQLIEKLSEK
jgi:hypothetical protein